MRILDATCSYRAMWFNKQYPNTTYIDIREEVKPDIVMNCTKTTFEDKSFDLILFDPPHAQNGLNSKFIKIYGSLKKYEILILVRDAFKEFNRILQDDGIVIFKWNDHDVKLNSLLPLIKDFEPLFGQKTSEKTKHASRTYWIVFKKLNLL